MRSNSSQEKRQILELNGISKSFPGVKALDNVSMSMFEGDILCILGENGAGKSTLMKILSGLYSPDTGEILVNQKWFNSSIDQSDTLTKVSFDDPSDAMNHGIGMVYQHFKLINRLSVTENIILGKEITSSKGLLIDINRAHQKIEELSKKYNLSIDPKEEVKNLPVGVKQRVEILKQLYRDAKLLIFDEPTAVLTPTEAEELFHTMEELRKAGKSIIFITHKLKEPLKIADHIIVLRDGKVVGETSPENATEEKLASMVVGRKVLRQYDRKTISPGDLVLSIKGLSIKSMTSDSFVVKNIDLNVNRFEILGIAGVQGNGQSELVQALMGIREIHSGSINIYNRDNEKIDIADKSTQDIINAGVGYIPEDRLVQGLISSFDVTENCWLGFHSSEKYPVGENEEEESAINFGERLKRTFVLPIKIMQNLANKIVKNYDVHTPSIRTKIQSLSGGNQQKIILGREFAKNPSLIIASEPTRGLDIGVLEQVHQELIDRRSDGAAILVISSDLDEILSLSDRIAVMYEGEIVGKRDAENFSIDDISQLMTMGRLHSSKNQEVEI